MELQRSKIQSNSNEIKGKKCGEVNHKSNGIMVVRTITRTKNHNQLLNITKIPPSFDLFASHIHFSLRRR